MIMKCKNESCNAHNKEVVIDNPTPYQEPKYGITMFKEFYCKKCNSYGDLVNSVNTVVKVSSAQNGKIYG